MPERRASLQIADPREAFKQLKQDVLYPQLVLALVFLAAMDVMLTHTILELGGVEANPLAARVFETAGTFGMSIYKFTLLALYLLILQFIGSRSDGSGRKLAGAGVLISMFPIAVALIVLPSLVAVSMYA